MIHSLLSAVTFALLIVCSSADISERPCFIPPLESMVVNNRTIDPYEVRQSADHPSLHNLTKVNVRAFTYKWSFHRYYTVKGMLVSLRSTLKSLHTMIRSLLDLTDLQRQSTLHIRQVFWPQCE